MPAPKRPPAAGGRAAGVLGLACVGFFLAPFLYVSSGYTVAGDRQKEGAQDIAKITASDVQHGKYRRDKP